MGLLDSFSESNLGKNLLDFSSPQRQQTLLGISQALAAPSNRGDTRMSKIMDSVSKTNVSNKEDSDKRMSQILSAMPKGVSFKDISPESKAMIKDYLRTGDQTLLMNIDFGTGTSTNKAVSPYGKQATDEGLTIGTPEFETRVSELSKAAKSSPGSTGTSSMENVNALIAHRVRLSKEVTAGTMTQDVMNERMDVIRQQLGGGVDKGKTALANANVSNLEEQWVKYDTDSDLATDNMATINQSIALLDSGVYTGFGGEAMSDLQNLGVSLGFSPPDANVGAEQFRVNSMKSVMDWIALTKGAISEKEMALFAAASPGLSRTVEGNRMILATAKKAAEWKQQRSEVYNEWYLSASKDGNIPNSRVAKNYIKSWEKAHQLVLPTAAEISAAKAGTQVGTTGAGQTGSVAVPDGVTAAEWAAMSAADKALWNN